MFGTLKKKLLLSIDRDFGIADSNGRIVLCSDDSLEGSYIKDIETLDLQPGELIVSGDFMYSAVVVPGKLDYVAYLKAGNGGENLLRMIVLFTETFFNNMVEDDDESGFYRKILFNKLEPGEMEEGIEKHRIRDRARRAVIVLQYSEADYSVSEMIRNIFPEENGLIVELGRGRLAYIMELKDEEGVTVLGRKCRSMVDTIEEELMVSVQAGIGNIVENFGTIHMSCTNAELALSVGDIFEYENNISDYNTLGIGKLIYTSDRKVLEDFLDESVSRKTFELLDDEIIKTVQSFFKNNLNISETARQMYLHRNTLVYRIEKVMKITGLDLRNFDDAVSFKAAYMVKCYIDKLNQER